MRYSFRARLLDRQNNTNGSRKTTLSILRVSTLFFVQEMSNSVIDVIETLRDALES